MELVKACEELDVKKFRANQLWEWLWQKSARSFDEMTNIPDSLRITLAENFLINNIIIFHSHCYTLFF